MTDDELKAIWDRLDAATPGPWEVVTEFVFGPVCEIGPDLYVRASEEAELDDGHSDAEFIAHAPTDIAALLAEVERLRAALMDARRDEGYP